MISILRAFIFPTVVEAAPEVLKRVSITGFLKAECRDVPKVSGITNSRWGHRACISNTFLSPADTFYRSAGNNF